ncbi:MAG: TraM recognition domain-containing protein [Actinobacteria bacterium]|nr:TraM recognition domain-containing protein [Actinomycetota bacterium]
MKRTVVTGLVVLGAGAVLWLIPEDIPGHGYWPLLTLLGLTILAGAAGTWRRRRRSSAGTVTHWSARSRRRHGVASWLDIARFGSFVTVRAKGTTVRPSLRELSRLERLQLPTTEIGVPLCRVGALRVWASTEDVITVFGGPRTGKTGWLAGTLIDAPGAVLTTSTRLDLYQFTSSLRASEGRPVFVFNPGGVGDLPSTISFNPLLGCADPVTATERAADMIPDAGGSESERWDAKARRYLAVLLHAAALGELSCATVAEWVADISNAEREILGALRRSPEVSYLTAAKQLIGMNERTQTSITDAISPAFSWLTNPSAAAAAAPDEPQLDIEQLLKSRGTVYLLGRHEGHTAPLLAALTGHIARTARRFAALQTGGRLDPPLMLALDEAARIAPVPLPDWSGDMGGFGVNIVALFQSRADMRDRWGDVGAAKILNNSGSCLVFGGTKDGDDLKAWADLTGMRDEPTQLGQRTKTDPKTAVRQVPVLSLAQIANLPQGRVVVICRGMPPAVGRVRMAWKRTDVQRALQDSAVRSAVQETIPVGDGAGVLVDVDNARTSSVT